MENINIGDLAENLIGASNNCDYLESKNLIEDVLSNLNGSSPAEIYFVTFAVPGSSLLLSLITCMNIGHACLLNVILLLTLTVWSDYLYIILCAIGSTTLVTGFMAWWNKAGWPLFNHEKELVIESKSNLRSNTMQFYKRQDFMLNMTVNYEKGHLPFIEDYRGHLFLATAICILAVDFPVFPHRFAKTETYGWSVMDAGVGCFVAVHGICSSQARGNHISGFRKSLLSSIPLLLLGIMRLIAVKAVNYHESVSEYGVHWNFFFTLGITKIVCSALLSIFSGANNCVLAVGLATFHQWLLSSQGVTEYVLSENRDNLLQANKEGIFSILGFVVIYFIGVEIGKLVWKPRCKMKEWIQLLFLLITIGSSGWIGMHMLHRSIQPISRKMANLPYCIWVISLTILQIAIHLVEHLITAVFHKSIEVDVKNIEGKVNSSLQPTIMKSCLLWKSINYNGLFYFLLANILTGIVNISIDTAKVSNVLSLVILFIYLFILSSATIIMFRYSVRIKFW